MNVKKMMAFKRHNREKLKLQRLEWCAGLKRVLSHRKEINLALEEFDRLLNKKRLRQRDIDNFYKNNFPEISNQLRYYSCAEITNKDH